MPDQQFIQENSSQFDWQLQPAPDVTSDLYQAIVSEISDNKTISVSKRNGKGLNDFGPYELSEAEPIGYRERLHIRISAEPAGLGVDNNGVIAMTSETFPWKNRVYLVHPSGEIRIAYDRERKGLTLVELVRN